MFKSKMQLFEWRSSFQLNRDVSSYLIENIFSFTACKWLVMEKVNIAPSGSMVPCALWLKTMDKLEFID